MKTARLRLGIIPFLAMIVSSAIVLGVCQPAEAEEQPAVIKIQKLADDIYYPVIVAGVKNTQVKNDLNRTFFLHAKEIRSHDIDEKKQYEHDKLLGIHGGPYFVHTKPFVRCNKNSLLSISFLDNAYTGGAHGLAYEEVYNYDLKSGRRFRLNDLITTKAQLEKVNQYVKKQMEIMNKTQHFDFFIEDFKGIDPSQEQFYFDDHGIVLVFQEYEYAPVSKRHYSYETALFGL